MFCEALSGSDPSASFGTQARVSLKSIRLSMAIDILKEIASIVIEILKEIAAIVQGPQTGALATIVKTKGSTPRKAGAKMVVRPDGTAVGTICGGCVEAEVYAEA